ncbi:MAG: helix-turn-helix transcriptional regulator [Nitrospirota bacterium]
MENNFRKSDLLNRLREIHETTGQSLRELAAMSDLDSSYICLILNGQRNPSRDALVSLGISWRLRLFDVDELLLLAGYPPLGRSARREYHQTVVHQPRTIHTSAEKSHV